MKIKLLIFVCFSLLLSSYFDMNNFQIDKNKILWNKKVKLNWSQFQGIPNYESEYKAITTSNISVVSEVKSDIIKFKIACYFVKNLSWTKDTNSRTLLKHENLHFDISELVTRNIRKEYSKHTSKNINETSKELDKIYHYYLDTYLDSINKLYDEETKHGILLDKQKVWETKIKEEIMKMEKFSKTLVIVKRKK